MPMYTDSQTFFDWWIIPNSLSRGNFFEKDFEESREEIYPESFEEEEEDFDEELDSEGDFEGIEFEWTCEGCWCWSCN